jgi:hypothetical protein
VVRAAAVSAALAAPGLIEFLPVLSLEVIAPVFKVLGLLAPMVGVVFDSSVPTALALEVTPSLDFIPPYLDVAEVPVAPNALFAALALACSCIFSLTAFCLSRSFYFLSSVAVVVAVFAAPAVVGFINLDGPLSPVGATAAFVVDF